MKQALLTVVAAVMAASSVWGQDYPDGYLDDETRPKQYDFIQDGRQLNTQPDNGIYIQDGQKRVAR